MSSTPDEIQDQLAQAEIWRHIGHGATLKEFTHAFLKATEPSMATTHPLGLELFQARRLRSMLETIDNMRHEVLVLEGLVDEVIKRAVEEYEEAKS